MQTSKWGNPAWRFLHRVPLCCSDSLTEEQKEQWIEFMTLFQDMLPCKYCRQSYKDFIAEDPLVDNFTNPAFKGDCRLAIAHWLYQLHNKVNSKLEKEICVDFYTKCCQGLCENVADWESAFWDFILTILWNFQNEEWRITSYKKFFTLLPKILHTCQLGKNLQNCLSQQLLTDADLIDTKTAKQWGWKLWSRCHSAVTSPQFASLEQMTERYDSWRSMTCSNEDKVEPKSKPHTC